MSHKKKPVAVSGCSVLEFDAGNTRLKWRVLREGLVADAGYLVNSDAWRVQLPVLLDRFGPIGLARASLVSGSRRKALLIAIISGEFGIPIVFARPCQSRAGVTIAYNDFSSLGVDRWLAMLAAQKRYPSKTKIIVDCGTALTLDVVGAQGRHLGGFIVPGLGMMRRSLQMNTADLSFVDDEAKNGALGQSTQECIGRGVLVMAASLVNTQAGMYKDAVVVLAGGDAEQIMMCVDVECVLHPELVMDGLALAFDA